MRWLVDFDSTLSATMDHQLELVNERFGTSFTRDDLISWNTEEYMTPEQAAYMWGDDVFFNLDFQAGVKPVEGAIEGVMRMLDNGHEVFVVSDRAEKLYDGTRKWLDMQGLAGVDLIFTRSPKHSKVVSNGAHTKSQVAYYKRLKTVVEDAPHHAEVLANRSYIDKVYLIDMPYNRGIRHPKVERIYSWEEVS